MAIKLLWRSASSIFSCISTYLTSSPAPASAWLVAIAFDASSRSFLNRIKDLFPSTNATKFLCTYYPLFFLSCLLASEVAKLLQYVSAVWLVSTRSYNFYFYFWFWSWLLSCDFAQKSSAQLCWFWMADNHLVLIQNAHYISNIAEIRYICLSGTFFWASSSWLLKTTPPCDCSVAFFSASWASSVVVKFNIEKAQRCSLQQTASNHNTLCCLHLHW